MLRKIFISLFILILLTTITLGYLYFHKQREYKGTDPLNAVPSNSELIIQCENASTFLSRLKEPEGIWSKLGELGLVTDINNKIAQLDSLLKYSTQNNSFNLERPLLISSNLSGKDQIDYLFVIPVNDFLEEKNIKTFINNQATIKERKYNRTILYKTIPQKKGALSLNYSFSNGLMLISQSGLLLEDAIRQLSSGTSISQNEGFSKLNRTKGKNVDANIYVNLKTLPKQIAINLDSKYRNQMRNYTNLANWVELDLSLKENSILLNGFTYSDSQQPNYLNLFKDQEPVSIEIESVLPYNTSLMAVVGIKNPLLFKEQYRKYLEKRGEINKYLQNLNEINQKTGQDTEETIYSILYQEMALVFTGNSPKNRFAVIRTQSASVARDIMLKILTGFANKQQGTLQDYTFSYKLDSETIYTIYKFPHKDLLYNLFGDLFKETDISYFTFIGNYMIMGASVDKVSGFIYDSVLGKSLSSNNKYTQNRDFLSNKANFHLFTSLTHSLPIFSGYLNDNLKSLLKSEKETLRKIQSVGIQFSSSKNLIYNNILLQYDPILEIPPQTDWESNLDTCFGHKPFLVLNHNTREKEILIQDLKNQIYLINTSGRILWKRDIGQPILGEIHQIDYYKNNKLQYLFATKTSLHLIDRNGNDVAAYPIKLKSPATHGVSLFDYDNNKNYRLFIPCKNKAIYAYSKEGDMVKGWSFSKADNPITSQIQHFRVGKKDYIVFSDKFRIYILNRRGKERVKLEQQFAKSELNSFYLDKSSNKAPRLITTDTSGNIVYCYLNGKVEKITLEAISDNHRFIPDDLNRDGKPEFIITDKNKLKIISNKGKSLLSKEFPGTISYTPAIYSFSSNNKKIGLCLESENQIYLVNTNGDIHKGFPLRGNTPFTIGISNKSTKPYYLLVGDHQNSLMYYTIE